MSSTVLITGGTSGIGIPPAVNTNLGGAGVYAAGVDLDEFADSVYRDILDRKDEIVYGFSAISANRTRREMETDARRGTKRSQSLKNGN